MHLRQLILISGIFVISIFYLFSFNINYFDKKTKIIDTSNINANIDYNKNDIAIPSIQNISPSKCQQYIVGKPCIEATYNDESGIDISSVKLFVNYKDVTNKCIITNNKISYTPEKKFRKGNQIVKLMVSDYSPNKNKAVFEWYFTVGTPVYNHYRGLLHAHTSASDGHGSYSDAYYMARDKANLDFFAITDHSNNLDNSYKCTIKDANHSTKWNNLIDCRDKFTLNGEFIALNGFEMTYDHNTIDPVGHINIFNSNGFVSNEDPNMNLDHFYDLLYNQDDLIGQFNHPCNKFGKFKDFKYSRTADEVISLIEVGNGSNKDISKNIRSYDMYQIALDKGWHLAPTCNQDNHKVNFGIANEFRTVVLATELSRDAIYDSLKKMRVYATEDKNIKIDYNINDLPMGSTLINPAKINFSISAIDNDSNDKIKEIQVISNNGEIIKNKTFNSNLAKLEFSIKPEKNKFYYIKVIQNLYKISVTAPIWIK